LGGVYWGNRSALLLFYHHGFNKQKGLLSKVLGDDGFLLIKHLYLPRSSQDLIILDMAEKKGYDKFNSFSSHLRITLK